MGLSNTYVTLLGIYTEQFTQQWESAMKVAAYAFRTTNSVAQLTTALDALNDLAKQADALADDMSSKSISGSTATSQVANLLMLISAQENTLVAAVKSVEGLDQSNLKNAAALDQAGLKASAKKLKSGADATLVSNIKNFVAKLGTDLNAAAKSSGSGGGGDVKRTPQGPSKKDLEKALQSLNLPSAVKVSDIAPEQLMEDMRLSGTDEDDPDYNLKSFEEIDEGETPKTSGD